MQSLFLHVFAENYLTELNIPDSVTYLGGGVFSANSVTGDKAFIYGKKIMMVLSIILFWIVTLERTQLGQVFQVVLDNLEKRLLRMLYI